MPPEQRVGEKEKYAYNFGEKCEKGKGVVILEGKPQVYLPYLVQTYFFLTSCVTVLKFYMPTTKSSICKELRITKGLFLRNGMNYVLLVWKNVFSSLLHGRVL